MNNFLKAILFVLENEGLVGRSMGYVNDPEDDGGETLAGIARKYHPDIPLWGIIDARKRQYSPDEMGTGGRFDRDLATDPRIGNEIRAFYEKEFWLPNHLHHVTDDYTAYIILDSIVLCGSWGARWAQEILNEIRKSYSVNAWPKVDEDGALGPQTVGALNAGHETSFTAFTFDEVFAALYLEKRETFHRVRVAQYPSQAVFLDGWINRVEKLRNQKIYFKE